MSSRLLSDDEGVPGDGWSRTWVKKARRDQAMIPDPVDARRHPTYWKPATSRLSEGLAQKMSRRGPPRRGDEAPARAHEEEVAAITLLGALAERVVATCCRCSSSRASTRPMFAKGTTSPPGRSPPEADSD